MIMDLRNPECYMVHIHKIEEKILRDMIAAIHQHLPARITADVGSTMQSVLDWAQRWDIYINRTGEDIEAEKLTIGVVLSVPAYLGEDVAGFNTEIIVTREDLGV